MIAGLGIDFNPPPSPERTIAAAHPALARIQGQSDLGRSPIRSFSANNALVPSAENRKGSLHRRNSEDGVAVALAHRRVRIVSAANVYHESGIAEQSPDLHYGQQGEEQDSYANEDDILDEYAEYIGDYEEDSDDLPSEGARLGVETPLDVDYSTTPMSIRSMSAVSSGSSARGHDISTMQHVRSLGSLKAEEFEANLRGHRIHTSSYESSVQICGSEHIHEAQRLQTVGGPVINAHSTASIRTGLPPPLKSGLRRATAMSRPKSMMELSQLYAYQSIETSTVPVLVHSHHYSTVGLSAEGTRPNLLAADSDTSPLSVSTDDSEGRQSLNGGHSTAPSSVHGSVEMGPSAVFASKLQEQNASAMTSGLRSHQLVKARSAISMRSAASMYGLEPAETGGSAVVLDSLGRGFLEGVPFDPRYASELISPSVGNEEARKQIRQRAVSVATSRVTAASSGLSSFMGTGRDLQRQSTLLSASANPAKRAKELERLLAPKPANPRSQYSPSAQPYSSVDLPCQPIFSPGGTASNPPGAGGYQPGLKRKPSSVVLEQATKGKARVELDLILASSLVVEGGNLKGKMEVRVRKERDGEGEVWLGAVKARIVGFEGIWYTSDEEAIRSDLRLCRTCGQ